MKEKILAELVKKFPGLSKAFLGLLADKLTTKVTEESQIEGALAELDNSPISITDLEKEFQKEGDRRVIEAKKEFLKKPPKPDNPKDEPPKGDPPTGDEPPAWAKAMMTELASLKAEKARGTMQSRLKEKLKDIPEKFYANWALPEKESEEDFEAHVQKIQTSWNEFKDDQVAAGLMNATKPVNGESGNPGKQQASKEELDAVMKNIM